MLNKKVKKETFDGSILTFEAWVHFLQQRQHTNMTKMEKKLRLPTPKSRLRF